MDILLSIIGILILLPVYAIISIAIKVNSKGPAIFKQVRIGKTISLSLYISLGLWW